MEFTPRIKANSPINTVMAASLKRSVNILLFTVLTGWTVSLLSPSVALAATWPVPASQPSPSLAFHQSYDSAGHSYVHCGIDIAASAGSRVDAPVAGTVSFVGMVPSGDGTDGSDGSARMLAVSIRIGDGRTVTLMPFESVTVEPGQRVGEGQGVGSLAVSGDRSSAASHLHLGLKHGAAYLDPMSLFGLCGAAEPLPVVEQAGALEAPCWEQAGAVAQGVPAASGAAPEPAAPSPQEEFGLIATGLVEWEPDCAPAVSSGGLPQLLEGCLQACEEQACALSEALGISADATFAMMAVALGLAILGALGAAAPHAMLHRLPQCINSSLFDNSSDGILLGLFPAPGTPSSPGAV